MKKIIAIVLVISVIVAIPGDLAAREKRGIELKILKKEGQVIIGYLVAVKVKQKSLLLMEKFSELDVTVSINDVDVIILKKRLNGAKGLGFGFLSGALIGTAVHEKPKSTFHRWGPGSAFHGWGPGEDLWLGGIIGGYYGAILGAWAGIGRRIWIERKSESEIEDILEKLRKKARVPDYN